MQSALGRGRTQDVPIPHHLLINYVAIYRVASAVELKVVLCVEVLIPSYSC